MQIEARAKKATKQGGGLSAVRERLPGNHSIENRKDRSPKNVAHDWCNVSLFD